MGQALHCCSRASPHKSESGKDHIFRKKTAAVHKCIFRSVGEEGMVLYSFLLFFFDDESWKNEEIYSAERKYL
jgi:hypothetical protein